MRDEILITGAAGFVGSRLFHHLITREMKGRITAVDSGMFGMDAIELDSSRKARDHSISHLKISEYLETFSLKNVKTIIHLSGLSNDPSADYSPEGNEELNFIDTCELAHAAQEAGVERFIFASSASVYGFNDSKILNESCAANPFTNYTKAKYDAEEYLRKINQEYKMKCIALRKGTIMGTSRRMRFDLVVNAMVMQVMSNGSIVLQGGGAVWRPLVSIRDVVDLYTFLIEMSDDRFSIMSNGFEYNVVGKNYRISELALEIREYLSHETSAEIYANIKSEPDKRSYRISGTKLDPYFQCKTTLDETIGDIYTWIKQFKPKKDDPIYYNIKWIETCEKVCKTMEYPFTMLKR